VENASSTSANHTPASAHLYCSIHVADELSPVGLDQAGTQLMQEIFSPIRDFGVNRSGSLSMAGALCAGQIRFQVAVKALGLDRWQSLITERGKRSQPQIDSHTGGRAIEDRSDRGFISLVPDSLRARHTDIQIPATAAVFAEITCTQFDASQTVAVPQRQPPSREVDLSASIANRSGLKGNPAQRPACTATLTPGEPNFSMLAAAPRVTPLRNGQKSNRQKPPLALEHFDRQVVAIIKDRVHLARQAAKPRRVLVLHPQAQDPNVAGRSRAGHPYSIPKSLQNTGKLR
jgi:hypothetical protein